MNSASAMGCIPVARATNRFPGETGSSAAEFSLVAAALKEVPILCEMREQLCRLRRL